VPGCKERAVRERADQDGGYGDAPQEHVEDDDPKPHGRQRVRTGDDHAARHGWYHTEREQQPDRRHPHGECNHYETRRDIPGQNLGAARLVAEPADLYLMAGTS
jgi:hypothetical protein